MSPTRVATKVAMKRAARFNLYIFAIAAIFSFYAIAKGQQAEAVPGLRLPVAVEAVASQR